MLNDREELQEMISSVRERFPNINFPNPAREPVWWGRRGRDRIDGRSAIVDSTSDPDNPIFYTVVSDLYGLRQHEEVVYKVLEVCDDLPEFGKPSISIRLPLIANGGKMRMEAVFKDVDYTIRNGDTIHPKISVFNSIDLGWKLKGMFGAFQLVCSNGMIIGEKWAEFAKRHMESLMISELVESVRAGMILFSEQTETWKKWAETQINHDGYARIWEELPFGEKQKEAIEELPQAGTQLLLPAALNDNALTLWDFTTVVTQFLTHELESDLRRADLEPKVARTFANHYRRAA